MATSESKENLVFDHRTLRLIVGGIAFSFSLVVFMLATTITSSISASYHTNARDVFVGFLFVIGILLIGYRGHAYKPTGKKGGFWYEARKFWAKHQEDLISTIGGFAAIAAAVCPTACDTCTRDLKSNIHTVAATILFSIVVYFCWFPFLDKVLDKLGDQIKKDDDESKLAFLLRVKRALKGSGGKVAYLRRVVRRGWVYLFCGLGIAVVLLALVAAEFTVLDETRMAYHLTFWAETIALFLFGIAWMTASQFRFIRKIWLLLILRRPVKSFADVPESSPRMEPNLPGDSLNPQS